MVADSADLAAAPALSTRTGEDRRRLARPAQERTSSPRRVERGPAHEAGHWCKNNRTAFDWLEWTLRRSFASWSLVNEHG
jgi:hypothetical protein